MDAWEVLGLAPGASLDEARAARRRLAKELHPDLHSGRPPAERAELARRMTQVNLALAEVTARLDARPEPVHPAAAAAATDDSTLSIEALPAEAFEALFLVAYGLGDILVADEPYLLEAYLAEPPCFCRLELAPEAGGSIVSVEVEAAEGTAPPTADEIRDLLVAELGALAYANDRSCHQG